jgi:hypothetical protein
MKAPLKQRHVNAVNAHQYLVTRGLDDELIPYLCPKDKSYLLAREEGLYCLKCEYETDIVTYPGKMNIDGVIKRDL